MTDTVLTTKLFIPHTRPALVHRIRLTERLNTGLHRKMTLVSAPAGFGKTTLITDWFASIGEKFKIAWLSLDEHDNDPSRFATYLVASLKQIKGMPPSFGQDALGVLKSPQLPPLETAITSLINELAQINMRFILVMDDYHLIEDQAIHDALTFLMQFMPSQLHLVIITREDPLFSLASLRAKDQLTEIRAADLRFTISEAEAFFNQVMGLNLSTDNIDALESRTEGWIAGLQLAAISLREQADPSKLIESFSGSHRLVVDYLIEEVLQQKPPHIQEFLLNTAVLDRLSGPLCDAVRFENGQYPQGEEDGQSILEMLERTNLFVIPLDNERKWYRYHHLFADLLRQQLLRTAREMIPRLHSRASAWFEQHGLFDEAIQHALSAEDFSRSAALLAELADPLWERGEHVKLRTWLANLPEKWVYSQPQLCLYHAWFLFSTGQQERAKAFLQAVENVYEPAQNQDSEKTGSLSEAQRLKFRGQLGAIWSQICTWQEDLQGIVRHARLALDCLPAGDPWRRMASMALGDAQYYQGDVRAAYQTRLEIQAVCQPEDDLFFYMIANLKVATSLREMGNLNGAIEICQQQLEFAQAHGLSKTIFAGWAYTIWALVLAEQNKLEEALEYANRSLALNLGGDFSFLGFSYITLVKIHFYLGDYAAAESYLQKLEDIKRNHYLPFHHAGSLAGWRARLMLAQGQLDSAAEWIAEQDSEDDEKTRITYDHVILAQARLLIYQGNLEEAASLLARLNAVCEEVGHTARMIEIFVLQALTQQAAGDVSSALQYLERAVKLAAPGGFVRVFVDEGPQMARLLYEAVSNGAASGYVQQLLSAFPDVEPEPTASTKIQSHDGEWVESLSEREIEVLQLIAKGLTNPEVGSRLFLSLNTVKVHTRNIYSKLAVRNRTQAVAKAKALGIISAE